jgi:hypothetical protein
VTPRPPLGCTRPLATTIAPPGSPAPAARRRGAPLSWRRAARIAAGASARHEVHHHWPLTVNLLFRSTVTAPATPPAQPAPGAAAVAPGQVAKAGMTMIWERRDAIRNAPSQTPFKRSGTAPQPSATQPSLPSAMRSPQAVPDPSPSFARMLYPLIEQRWLRTRMTFHSPVEHGEAGTASHSPADRHFPVMRPSRRSDIPLETHSATRRTAPSLSRPMRPDDRPLFTADPLVHRSLRRISVTPSAPRPADTARTATASSMASPVRRALDIAPARPARAARAHPAEQVWSAPQTAAGASFAQPFAPIFSSPGMSAPAIAVAPGPVAAPAAAAPDVNRLVDEVMRRIERQTRQDRQRRGM